LRSVFTLQLGKHITRIGTGFWLNLEPEDLKAGPPWECDVPAGLISGVERYLVIRGELLRGGNHDAFWVSQNGKPLAKDTIGGIIRSRSRERFGFSFSPHRFRHGMGTSAPLHDPAHPGVASAILNNSSRMVEKHYNLASAAQAAVSFHATLRDARAHTKSLAQRELRKRRRLLKPRRLPVYRRGIGTPLAG
jgi:hypothetical protein